MQVSLWTHDQWRSTKCSWALSATFSGYFKVFTLGVDEVKMDPSFIRNVLAAGLHQVKEPGTSSLLTWLSWEQIHYPGNDAQALSCWSGPQMCSLEDSSAKEMQHSSTCLVGNGPLSCWKWDIVTNTNPRADPCGSHPWLLTWIT